MYLVICFALNLNISSIAYCANINVAGTQLPSNLGNPYKSISVTPGSLLGLIYDGLTLVDEEGQLQPALATSWKSDGNRKWVFKIRDGVYFHNNILNSAENIAQNINFVIQDENLVYPISVELKSISYARPINNSTLEIITHQRDPMLPKKLSLMRIVDFATWSKIGADNYSKEPIGTGPFYLKSWNEGGAVKFIRFKKYWATANMINNLKIYPLKDPISRVQALVSGQVDIALGLSPDDIDILQDNQLSFKVNHSKQVLAIALPNMNKKESPLNNIQVRQALNYAIDRKSIVREILGGHFNIANQGATKENFGYNENIIPYNFDPEKARLLLKESGYGKGFSLILEVLIGLGPADSLIYQRVVQDLSKINIKVSLKTTSYTERTRKYFTNDWNEIDAFSILWNNSPYNDTGRSLESFSCIKLNPFFCDREIAEKIKKSKLEMNTEERKKQLENIMSEMNYLAPSINIIEYGSIIGLNKLIRDIVIEPTGVAYEKIIIAN